MEFIALIAALIALVWSAVLVRRGGLLAGCVTVIVAGTVFGPPFFSLAGGPMPITLDRVLLVLLVVMYGAYRWLGWASERPMTAADMVLLGLIGVLTLSVFSHDWKINRSQPLSYLVFLWLMPLALYWVARHATVTERGLRGVFLTFAVLGIYLAFTAVFEAKYKWDFVFPRYIVSPEFKEWLGRGRGPLLNPAGNGLLMSICLACGFTVWPRLGNVGKWAMVCLFAPIMFAGIYFTLTRSAWMGAGLAALLLVGVYLPKLWRTPAIVLTLAASLIFVAANWEDLLAFKRDKELTAADAADSASLRPILAYVATQMFWDRPLLGCGLGHYLDACPPYLADRSIDLPLAKLRPYVQHNALLSLLVETGLLGGVCFLLMWILWLREAWQLWRSDAFPIWQRQAGLVFLAAFAAYLPNAIFQDTTVIPMANMLMFFFAAIALNLRQTPIESTAPAKQIESIFSADVEREWFGSRKTLEHV